MGLDSGRKGGWRSWILQFALLVLLGLHNVGLLHHHATSDEQNNCVACQFSDHQALDVPDAVAAAPLAVLVLLCLLPFRPVPAVRGAKPFSRALSRAPPFPLVP